VTKRAYGRTWGSRVRWGILAATSATALAAAPAAQAAKPHSLHGEVVHLHAADRATARLLAAPTGPLASMYLARSQQQLALATGVAASIVHSAHGRAGAESAAAALGLLADDQTSQAQSLTSVLGTVSPTLEAGVAQAISTATGGRQGVLGVLSGLLPGLSRASRPVVAQVVALESTQGAQVPVQIAGMLGANSVACAATGAVQQALVVSTQAFQLGLSVLGPALALVPAGVRAQVQREIDGIPALLTEVERQLAQALPCSGSPAAGTSSSTPPVKAVQAPTLLGGMTQLIDGILGTFLPGLLNGQSPTPVAAPGPLTGLLGGLLGGGLH
jgi:hypothetical protein